jgi:hypothetical protein
MRYHDFMSDIPSPDPAIQAPPPELPLAPPVMAIPRTPAQRRLEVRIWSAFVFVLCAGMLGIGLWLTPKPAGTGSHEELGLPPCSFLATTGYPCPTCGCTTAVSHFAHGHILTSLLTQPFGFTVALAALIAACLSLVGIVTGKWIGPAMFTLQWYWRVWVFGGVGILVFGWVYKIMMVRLMVG